MTNASEASFSSLAVVHLASSSLGVGAFRDFVASYRRRDAGLDHDLVVVYNGFAGPNEPEAFAHEVADLAHSALYLGARQIDLSAYFEAARRLPHTYVCCLNSESVILADGWLAALHHHASRPEVGMAGATGSWESHLTAHDDSAPPEHHGLLASFRRMYDHWQRRRDRSRLAARFPPYPNPHLRTNAFVTEREVLILLAPSTPPRSKLDAHALESGRQGISAQLRRRGLSCVVVGRNGAAYEPDEWPDSRTFRAGAQDNLLVSDKRTRQYEHASPGERARLTAAAWRMQ